MRYHAAKWDAVSATLRQDFRFEILKLRARTNKLFIPKHRSGNSKPSMKPCHCTTVYPGHLAFQSLKHRIWNTDTIHERYLLLKQCLNLFRHYRNTFSSLQVLFLMSEHSMLQEMCYSSFSSEPI